MSGAYMTFAPAFMALVLALAFGLLSRYINARFLSAAYGTLATLLVFAALIWTVGVVFGAWSYNYGQLWVRGVGDVG